MVAEFEIQLMGSSSSNIISNKNCLQKGSLPSLVMKISQVQTLSVTRTLKLNKFLLLKNEAGLKIHL